MASCIITIGNEVWERLSASIVAAGKPLPQGCKKATSLEGPHCMKALVFGLGLQGKAVIHDLEQSDAVSEIVAADVAAD